jgi:hypothetical protein
LAQATDVDFLTSQNELLAETRNSPGRIPGTDFINQFTFVKMRLRKRFLMQKRSSERGRTCLDYSGHGQTLADRKNPGSIGFLIPAYSNVCG